jgi:putative addiction module CopG family antidote
MNLRLSPELEGQVREKVASGAYRDQEDVVAKALRLLDVTDRRAALEAALDEGDADLREGRFIDIDTDEEFDAFIADL